MTPEAIVCFASIFEWNNLQKKYRGFNKQMLAWFLANSLMPTDRPT